MPIAAIVRVAGSGTAAAAVSSGQQNLFIVLGLLASPKHPNAPAKRC
jgi:hypothetical protein